MQTINQFWITKEYLIHFKIKILFLELFFETYFFLRDDKLI